MKKFRISRQCEIVQRYHFFFKPACIQNPRKSIYRPSNMEYGYPQKRWERSSDFQTARFGVSVHLEYLSRITSPGATCSPSSEVLTSCRQTKTLHNHPHAVIVLEITFKTLRPIYTHPVRWVLLEVTADCKKILRFEKNMYLCKIINAKTGNNISS